MSLGTLCSSVKFFLLPLYPGAAMLLTIQTSLLRKKPCSMKKQITKFLPAILGAIILFTACGSEPVTDRTVSSPSHSSSTSLAQNFIPDCLPGEENQYGNTSANLASGMGWACGQGDWIYYLKGSTPGHYDQLWKFNTSTGEMALLYESKLMANIQVTGNWVFFTDAQEDTAPFCRIRTDGSEYAPIVDRLVDDCLVYDNMLYYAQLAPISASVQSLQLCCSTLDGMESTCIAADIARGEDPYVRLLGIEGNSLYYIYDSIDNGASLVEQCDLESGAISTVISNETGWPSSHSELSDYFVQNGMLGCFVVDFLGRGTLYISPLDSAEEDMQTFHFGQSFSLNLCGPTSLSTSLVTFVQNSSQEGIVWGTLQTGIQDVITPDSGHQLCVVGDWVCYIYNEEPYCIKLDGTGWQSL